MVFPSILHRNDVQDPHFSRYLHPYMEHLKSEIMPNRWHQAQPKTSIRRLFDQHNSHLSGLRSQIFAFFCYRETKEERSKEVFRAIAPFEVSEGFETFKRCLWFFEQTTLPRAKGTVVLGAVGISDFFGGTDLTRYLPHDLFVWIVSAMTVTKVVEGCVYIRRRYYGILPRVGGEFEHSALSPISLSLCPLMQRP